jgi:tetratricopeptide (TPR) repeat protein
VRQNSRSFPCSYNLARTDSYLAQAKQAQKDNKAAEHWLDSGIEDAKHAIELDDRSSDAHALLGDLYGRKIGLGGAFAGMRYGPKANAETERAFQLDANNPRAYAVVGRKYLFAPKIFGGDLNQAIESFQKATTLDPHYDEAFVWLAIAYRKRGDSEQAKAALAEALRLNSRSAFARQTESESGEQRQ